MKMIRADRQRQDVLPIILRGACACIMVLVLTLIVVSVLPLPSVSVAGAATNLPPEVHILLGFKERYGADNKQHLGIDVAANKGIDLFMPVAGTVSFYGRVPGSAGLNVMAVTVTTPEGQQVSINPLATTTVSKGDVLSKGQLVGTVSDVGDPSVFASHFHLSLRVGGVYKDPTGLLAVTMGLEERGSVGGGTNVAVVEKPSGSQASAPQPAVKAVTQVTAQPIPKAVVKAAKPATQSVKQAGAKPAVSAMQAAGAKTLAAARVSAKAGTTKAASTSSEFAVSPVGATQLSARIPLRWQRIAGVDSLPSAAVTTRDTPSKGVSRWYQEVIKSLSHGQVVTVLFGVGLALSCAGIGVWTVFVKAGGSEAVLWVQSYVHRACTVAHAWIQGVRASRRVGS